jgi:hypothetical protein
LKKGDFVRVLPEGLQGIAVAVDVLRIQVAIAWPRRSGGPETRLFVFPRQYVVSEEKFLCDRWAGMGLLKARVAAQSEAIREDSAKLQKVLQKHHKKKIVLTMSVLVLVAVLPLPSPGTGIPVVDVSNLAQNVVTAMKQVSAYAQQVQQYQLNGGAW